MRVATIDIGTNTVLLLIAEVGEGGRLVPIVDRAEITRLGQGVDRARTLAPEAVERTLDCLSRYASEIAKSGATRVGVVGTSAMRDVGRRSPTAQEDGRRSPTAQQDDRQSPTALHEGGESEFIQRAAKILGVAPRVVSGDEEASLAFAGGLLDLGLEGDVTAFDVGGGSTELIRGNTGGGASEVRERTSLDVGSVRLFERHVRTDPPSSGEMSVVRAFVLDQLRGVKPPPPGRPLVGMAGTVTTLAAVARGIDPYDPAKVHGMRFAAAEVAAVGRRLCELSLAERKGVTGLEPKRADVIPVGAVIVEAVLGWARADEVIVSDRGVRWGLALELARSAGT